MICRSAASKAESNLSHLDAQLIAIMSSGGNEITRQTTAVPLFYVVDWLPPDFGAVGQHALMTCRQIAQTGRRVFLIGLTTGAENVSQDMFPGASTLEIRRISAAQYDKSSYLSRLLWTVRTNFKLMSILAKIPDSRGSHILFTGAPPFMLFFAVGMKWLRRARLIYRITDFYPEVIIAELGRRSVPLALFERLTWWLRRRVDMFEVLGEDQRRLLLQAGIQPEQIILKRDVSPVVFSSDLRPAQPPESLGGRKVLLYSGNYGVAHEVDTVVNGLIYHHRHGSGRFGLWVNASGARATQVEKRLRGAGVPVARTPPVAIEQLPALLAAADAHLIALRPQFSGIVLPSKVYACIASGRPVVFVGPSSSDVDLLCGQAADLVYQRVEPGDARGFAEALESLCGASNAEPGRSYPASVVSSIDRISLRDSRSSK